MDLGGQDDFGQQRQGNLSYGRTIGAVGLRNIPSARLSRPLPATMAFTHPTVAALARSLGERAKGVTVSASSSASGGPRMRGGSRSQ